MSKPPRDRSNGAFLTFFITANAAEGKSLLQSTRAATLFLDTLFSYRDAGKFQIHEFVVMPNHVHFLITLGNGTTLERALQLIKGGFFYRAKRELGINSEIWRRGYLDHRSRDESDYRQHRAYIPANPVRAHLAENLDEYPYGSAAMKYQLDAVPQRLKPLVASRVQRYD